MAITKTLFGRLKAVTCDRCGRVENPQYRWALFCESCNSISPTSIRDEDIRWPGWSELTYHSAEEVRCSVCGKPGHLESFTHVCVGCYGKHPDKTHAGSWGVAPHQVGGIEVDRCHRCAGICIREKTSERDTRRIYYKVGKKGPANNPYVCFDNDKELREKQGNCEHDYVEVFSNARTGAESRKIEARK